MNPSRFMLPQCVDVLSVFLDCLFSLNVARECRDPSDAYEASFAFFPIVIAKAATSRLTEDAYTLYSSKADVENRWKPTRVQ